MWVRSCGKRVAVRGYLVNELNKPGAFRGHIVHRENIGKSGDDLVVLYNELHPEDPVPA